MNDAVKNEIELLKQALAREKKARLLLENKLEAQLQKKFEINKELLESYENSRIRQVQLQFLSFLSKSNTEDKSFDEMLKYFTQNIASLTENASALIFKIINKKTIHLWHKRKSEYTWKTLPNDMITIGDVHKTNEWGKLKDKNDAITQILESKYLLSIRFPFKENSDVIIILGGNHFCYSEDFKHTLDIAAKQFGSIIQKRLTDAELSYNYQKLRKTMQALKETQNQLIHSEKMASLGTLAAGVAHEINNPLSYLTSNLDILQEYIETVETYINNNIENKVLKLSHDTKRIQEIIKDLPSLQNACFNATTRIADIVGSLRSFSRKDSSEKLLLNIKEPLKAALQILNNKLKDKYQIYESYDHESKLIDGNFGQLQQVFVNLLVNASHAMPDGGSIYIHTNKLNDVITLSIRDHGCGIEQKNLKKLFEPFFTTKNVNEGTGLGLSVTYAIINNHGARIEVKSKLGKGSEFIIHFPLP